MTDFGRQFWGIKSRAMDVVLFVRHGRWVGWGAGVSVPGIAVGIDNADDLLTVLVMSGCSTC